LIQQLTTRANRKGIKFQKRNKSKKSRDGSGSSNKTTARETYHYKTKENETSLKLENLYGIHPSS